MGIVENGIVPANKVAKDGDYDKWEIESAVETLAKAEEIKADLKLMKALRPFLEKKAKAYKSLDELRSLGTEMMKKARESGDADDMDHAQKMSAQEGEMGYKKQD